MFSAEEFLRSKDVLDLRRLVLELDGQASSKKAELQTMVGSKYHDFIQSADSIKNMQVKAEEMNAKLGTFLQSSQTLVSRTEELLLQTKQSDKILTSISTSTNTKHDAQILNDRNMKLNTSVLWLYLENCILSKASLLVGLVEVILASRRSIKVPGKSTFASLISPNLLSVVSGLPLSHKLVSQYRSVFFLSGTVRDDAYLFTLMKDNSALELSDSLCAIGMFDGCDRMSLLDLLLKARDTLMQSEATVVRNVHVDSLKSSLTSTVRILQKTVLDVYVIFLQVFEGNNVPGLLEVCQKKFNTSFRSAVVNFVNENNQNEVNCDLSVVHEENRAHDVKAIRSHFGAWLVGAVERVAALTARTLEAMDSTSSVSSLQQHVWKLSVHIDDGHNAELFNCGYTQAMWENASSGLLLPLRRRKNELEIPASQLLWSQALRQPFLHHVEHLLRGSCQTVLTKVKNHMIACLQQTGVLLNANTLAFIHQNNAPDNCSPFCANSSTVYCQAEAVRKTLEIELDLVFGDAQGSRQLDTGSHDAQASAALQRALVIQCAHLASQLCIFLRSVSLSLQDVLRASIGKDRSVSQTGNVTAASNGLLVIGRFAWMLRTRGGLLSVHLSIKNGIHSSTSASSMNYHLTSEQQLRSAFDIADANGDGCLTFVEALEAIQALSIGGDSAVLSFLSLQHTPSVTYSELALLCTSILQDCSPQNMFISCLEDLAEIAHSQWADFMLSELKREITSGLNKEFGPQSKSIAFTSLWTIHTVELDAELGESIRLPATPSSTLISFLGRLNYLMNSAILSIDTVQEWEGMVNVNAGTKPCLAMHLTSVVNTGAAKALTDAYNTLALTFNGNNGNREEQCILQILMDLYIATDVMNRCKVNTSSITNTSAKWKGLIDPINAQLLLPLLWDAGKLAVLQSDLLFSGFQNPTSSHHETSVMADVALQGVFSNVSSSRFALLPLAMSAVPAWNLPAASVDFPNRSDQAVQKNMTHSTSTREQQLPNDSREGFGVQRVMSFFGN